MRAAEALALTDALCPNAQTEGIKLIWLTTLEGTIYKEVLSWHDGAGDAPGEIEADTALLVQEPYSMLYIEYLIAMIHMQNAEYEAYTNAMMRYNALHTAYANAYNRDHMPLGKIIKT